MDLLNWLIGLSVIIVNAMLILGVVAKAAKDKAEMLSSINSNTSTMSDMRAKYDKEIDGLNSKNETSFKEMIREMKITNNQLRTMNENIIRFEERQETQWRIIQKHSKEIEELQRVRNK